MIIGITGKARSGKDSFAEMLAEELNTLTKKKFVLMAYANELKMRCQKDFDLSWEQLWGDEKETADFRYPKPILTVTGTYNDEETQEYWTAREIMQAYGQFFRTIHYGFWVDYLFRTIADKEYENVIVTDVRHPNEADPIKEKGGVVVKVISERSNKTDIHGENHISEIAMDYYDTDFIVANNLTLRELREATTETALLILEQQRRLQNG